VKLYSYSSESLTFLEAKWAKIKLAVYGILIASLIFFGLFKLDQSFGNILGSRSANAIAAENKVLRQEINLISPRVSKLELQARQLRDHASRLQILVAGDSLSRSIFAAKGIESPLLIPVETSFGR